MLSETAYDARMSGRTPYIVPDDGSPPDEGDLWFLPGPPDPLDELPTGRRPAGRGNPVAEWLRAQADCAAPLGRAAGRLGALDERLRRGPDGWRHRLALTEAADLAWLCGERIGPDRLALWLALRLSGVQQDMPALARAGWAARRLAGGPGPEDDLPAFLDRRDSADPRADDDPASAPAADWRAALAAGQGLHPIARACMGYHLWPRTGWGAPEDRLEAAVTALRLAMAEAESAVFAPLALGGTPRGAAALRGAGDPAQRLARWLAAVEGATLTALRQLDDLEAWSARAAGAMAGLSGRTPPVLRGVLTAWPLVSAPMAEAMTGASRAAIQRNLAWMEARGLIREVTGQRRFRMWRIV